MKVNPLHPVFAAELVGADLTQPPTAALVDVVESAMATYGVLVIRDAEISDAQQIQFSRAFGPLEIPSRPAGAPAARMAPELFAAGNLDKDGAIVPYAKDGQNLSKGAERFHTDSSFHTLPTKWLCSGAWRPRRPAPAATPCSSTPGPPTTTCPGR